MSETPYQSAQLLGSTLHIWIYIDPLTLPHAIVTAPVWLPLGRWSVVWNLVTLHLEQEGVKPERFAVEEAGVFLKVNPDVHVVVHGERRVSGTQYWMDVENRQAQGLALLGYGLRLGTPDHVHVYDPTIVVAQEPLVPPATGR